MKPRDAGLFFRTVSALGPSGMDFGLGRMHAVLSAFSNPQYAFPAIHVAGTNGKGSVSAMLAATLRKAGFRTGLYTSPHLIRLNERFQINGAAASSSDLNATAADLNKKLLSLGISLTQFEYLTAVMFLLFARKNVDVAVIETGLGGRLDATNVLRRVSAAVITNIDLEHTQWLGRTIKAIAFEKAGIIKPGVPVVTGAAGEALSVIRRVARRRNSPLRVVTAAKAKMIGRAYDVALKGRHQLGNAALVKETATLLSKRFSISARHIKKGVETVNWPGRFERVAVRTAGGRRTVILDGAHNPAAMKTLVQTLGDSNPGRVNVLFGALRDKDVKSMVKQLAPITENVVTVPLPSSRSRTAMELKNLTAWKKKARAAATIKDGWKRALALPGNQTLVVTGSLYLVGAVREILRK